MAKRLIQPYWSQDVTLTDADWSSLENLAGASLPQELRNRLVTAMNSYREYMDGHRASVRPGKVRPVLKRMQKAIEALEAALVPLRDGSPIGRATIREIQKAGLHRKAYIGRPAVASFHSELSTWAQDIGGAIASLPDDRGAGNDDPYIEGLLWVAHTVFEASGATGPLQSVELPFLNKVACLAGYRVQSQAALAKTFEKARKKVKAKSENSFE